MPYLIDFSSQITNRAILPYLDSPAEILHCDWFRMISERGSLMTSAVTAQWLCEEAVSPFDVKGCHVGQVDK